RGRGAVTDSMKWMIAASWRWTGMDSGRSYGSPAVRTDHGVPHLETRWGTHFRLILDKSLPLLHRANFDGSSPPRPCSHSIVRPPRRDLLASRFLATAASAFLRAAISSGVGSGGGGRMDSDTRLASASTPSTRTSTSWPTLTLSVTARTCSLASSEIWI